MVNDSQYRRMIRSVRWQRLRNYTIGKHPICEKCEKEGRLSAAQEVHHRVPVDSVHNPREKERLMFDPANLMCLCRECHAALHRQMRKGSKEERQARQADELRDIIGEFF